MLLYGIIQSYNIIINEEDYQWNHNVSSMEYI